MPRCIAWHSIWEEGLPFSACTRSNSKPAVSDGGARANLKMTMHARENRVEKKGCSGFSTPRKIRQ